ncbi:phage major capsid protein [Halomonas sp. HP20-15]|uniref:phage major capsid protein n=1 Tax=Halomonas sp. HP20-15 TaxID=3085901 RepID=UPI0029826389|nr:phage major capsid protein [Halomonas sp. HP20-15]MDW5376834.1 phage major capsid protein [Halomonas sp. HP20-15]
MKLHELKQRYNDIAKDMRALNEEIGDNAWSEEQRTNWKSMKTDLDALNDKIQREEQLRDADQRFVEDNEDEHRARAARDENGGASVDEQRAAFEAFLRQGMQDVTPEQRQLLREMRAQATSPGEAGGYTVPTEMLRQVQETMQDFGGIASVAQILTTGSGNTIEWPTSDGTGDMGELLGENQQTGEQDVEFGMDSLGAHKLSSKVIRVSNELLQDSGINMESYLAGRIGNRLARAEAHYIVKGTGAGTPLQPKGLEASVTASVATAAATTLKWQEINSLIHAVDPAYRRAAGYRLAFNDNTLKLIEEMVDSQGRPLWLPGVAGVAPSVVLNRQYVIDSGIADIGAGSKFMYGGDFKQFVLRRVNYMVLKRLIERYADFDQTGFLAFARFGCILQDAAAIKALQGKPAA